MATTEAEKKQILQEIKDGRKISEISDLMGISRDTIRKVKNGAVSNPPKPELAKFNEAFGVSGEEISAEELLKSVGTLAPQIIKERLEAGELVLSICGNDAATAGMKLKEYLKILDQLPEQFIALQSKNQRLEELITEQNETIDMQIDRATIKKCVNEMTMKAMEINNFDLKFIIAYENFLWSSQPGEFEYFRKKAELLNQGKNPDEYFEKMEDNRMERVISLRARADELLARHNTKSQVPQKQISS
jgi:transcriptional regulator with XRE-family HTH domain